MVKIRLYLNTLRWKQPWSISISIRCDFFFLYNQHVFTTQCVLKKGILIDIWQTAHIRNLPQSGRVGVGVGLRKIFDGVYGSCRILLTKENLVENIPLAKDQFLILSPFLRDFKEFRPKYMYSPSKRNLAKTDENLVPKRRFLGFFIENIPLAKGFRRKYPCLRNFCQKYTLGYGIWERHTPRKVHIRSAPHTHTHTHPSPPHPPPTPFPQIFGHSQHKNANSNFQWGIHQALTNQADIADLINCQWNLFYQHVTNTVMHSCCIKLCSHSMVSVSLFNELMQFY